MAIPTSPLVVKPLDVNEMTLDELALFEAGGFSALGFRQFLADHSHWTKAEIGKVKVCELKDIAEQLGKALQEAALPKVT